MYISALTVLIDDRKGSLRNKLFNSDANGSVTSPKYDPSISAQILELEFSRKGKDIRQSIVEILYKRINEHTVDSKKVSSISTLFKKHSNTNIITTNYDTLLSDHILPGFSKVIIEGSPIPKSNIGGNVFHIHGCISNPKSIVFTINDYFRFQHKDSYLSRKFYTLLQETTVVILGYALGDFNLNSIFNEAQTSRAVSLRKGDIYLVSRSSVDEIYTNFYSYTYGIHVVEGYDIGEFFDKLDGFSTQAQEIVAEASNLPEVLNGKKIYTDNYLKLRDSLS